MDRHRLLAGILGGVISVLAGALGYWAGATLAGDVATVAWILLIAGLLAGVAISYSGWRTLRALCFRFTEGIASDMAAIDRFEVELNEEIKEGTEVASEKRENPFEFEIILRDTWELRQDEIMTETGDRDRAERAHQTVKRDLEQLHMMEFFEKWIYDKNFDYLAPTLEDRAEFRRSQGS